ncbi:MAG: delta-60 repeat domain-containing protein, partial [Candidatus Udaeobacter sp.]
MMEKLMPPQLARGGAVVAGLALLICVPPASRGQSALDGFDPNAADGLVTAIAVQADGKILVAGGFTSIGGQTRNEIARFNADG